MEKPEYDTIGPFRTHDLALAANSFFVAYWGAALFYTLDTVGYGWTIAYAVLCGISLAGVIFSLVGDIK